MDLFEFKPSHLNSTLLILQKFNCSMASTDAFRVTVSEVKSTILGADGLENAINKKVKFFSAKQMISLTNLLSQFLFLWEFLRLACPKLMSLRKL